jgi:Leucine-rich repeat (LRR) protein
MQFLELVFLLLFLALWHRPTRQLQFYESCIPNSIDKRYVVCTCEKYSTIECVYKEEITEISAQELDPLIRPIFNDTYSPLIQKTESILYNSNYNIKSISDTKLTTYFPHFDRLEFLYEKIYLKYFPFIPSNGLFNRNHLLANMHKYTFIYIEFRQSQIVFDKNALSGLNAEMVLIEGEFDQLTMHADTFDNSNIDELKIVCSHELNDEHASESEACRIVILNNEQPNEVRLKSIRLFGVTVCNSTEWDLGNLPNVKNIEILDISNTRTRQHRLQAFRFPINQVSFELTELALRENSFEKIDADFCDHFPNLKKLDLSRNLIFEIDKNAFAGCPLLTDLNLDNNDLVQIPKFTGLKHLKYLSLKDNRIIRLVENQFETMGNLLYLDLSKNRIKSLNSVKFNGLHSLEQLDLSFNPFDNIDPNTFDRISMNLKVLTIISNTKTNWFNFDDSDLCMLKNFKCNQTAILYSNEQICNCFTHYLGKITVDFAQAHMRKQFQVYNKINYYDDNKNCRIDSDRFEVLCDPHALLANCFQAVEIQSNSCLYNHVVHRDQGAKRTSTTTSNLVNSYGDIDDYELLIKNDKQPKTDNEYLVNNLKNVEKIADKPDDQLSKSAFVMYNQDPFTFWSLIISCVALSATFISSAVFTYLFVCNRKKAEYSLVVRERC